MRWKSYTAIHRAIIFISECCLFFHVNPFLFCVSGFTWSPGNAGNARKQRTTGRGNHWTRCMETHTHTQNSVIWLFICSSCHCNIQSKCSHFHMLVLVTHLTSELPHGQKLTFLICCDYGTGLKPAQLVKLKQTDVICTDKHTYLKAHAYTVKANIL